MDQVTWYVGIDWGSESHAVCVVDAAGLRREERRVDHTVERGAGVSRLGDVVYRRPAVPNRRGNRNAARGAGRQLPRARVARLRGQSQAARSLSRPPYGRGCERRPAGCVGLGGFVAHRPGRVPTGSPEDPLVVQLRELSRAEEDLDAEFRRLANQLRSQVHRLVPNLLALCPGADEPWFWALLQLASTPAAQRRLTRARVDHLLRAHRIRRWCGADVVERLQGPSFPHAPGVVEAVDAQIRLILPRLDVVHAQRLACGRQLEQLLQQLRDRPRETDQRGEHRDIAILESLPGVGRKVAVTMLAEAAEPLAHRDYADCARTWGPRPSPPPAASVAWCRCGARATGACAGRRITGGGQACSMTRRVRRIPRAARKRPSARTGLTKCRRSLVAHSDGHAAPEQAGRCQQVRRQRGSLTNGGESLPALRLLPAPFGRHKAPPSALRAPCAGRANVKADNQMARRATARR